MNLEEQLKMATMTTTVVPQEQSAPVAVEQPIAPIQMEPATTPQVATVPQVAPAPVQYASVSELHTQPQQPILPTVNESNGIQQIVLGQQFNTRPIDVVKKLGIGERIRFTLLNTDGFFAKYHYVDGIGKFSCFEGTCCKELGNAKHRYILPVLIYPTLPNDANTIIQGQPLELKALAIWDDAVYDLIAQTSQDPMNRPVDYIATGTDNFGRMSVVPQGQCYKGQYTNDVNAAFEKWGKHKDTVPGLVCKSMNEQSYLDAKMKLQQAGPNNSANYSNNYGNYQNYNGLV